MKRFFAVILLVMAFAPCIGQNIATPFTRAPRNAQGGRDYKDFTPKVARFGISFGYGHAPMIGMTYWASDVFNHYGPSYPNLSSATTSNIGALTLGFNYFVNPWLELQFPVTMSLSDGNLTYSNRTYPYKEFFIGFTPNVKISWMYSPWVHIYSRAGVGFVLGNRHDYYNGSFGKSTINSRFGFSWQVSPVGIEVGRRVYFFAEVGYGTMGFVQAGLKMRFRKSNKDKSNFRSMNALAAKSYRYQEFRLPAPTVYIPHGAIPPSGPLVGPPL